MRAAQNQAIHRRSLQIGKRIRDDLARLIGTEHAPFDQRHEQRTSFGHHLDRWRDLAQRELVCAAFDRAFGTDDADDLLSGGLDRGARARVNDTDNRDRHAGANFFHGDGGCRVASDHDHFRMVLEQIIDDLMSKMYNFLGRSGTVRRTCRVAEVNDFFSCGSWRIISFATVNPPTPESSMAIACCTCVRFLFHEVAKRMCSYNICELRWKCTPDIRCPQGHSILTNDGGKLNRSAINLHFGGSMSFRSAKV